MKIKRLHGLQDEPSVRIPKPVKPNEPVKNDHFIDVATGQLPKFTALASVLIVKLSPSKKSGYMQAHLLCSDQELYDLGFKMGTPSNF